MIAPAMYFPLDGIPTLEGGISMHLAKEVPLSDGSGISTEELLRRARGGDERALDALFKRVTQKLDEWTHLPKHRTGAGGNRPSDVAQEVALRAHRSFKDFRGTTEGQLFAWLNSILVKQVAQVGRDAGRQKRSPPDLVSLDAPEPQAMRAQQPSPSQAVAGMEEWRRLVWHLAHLVEPQRDAIRLHHIEGVPVTEVAHRMGKSEDAVRSLLQRGMETLRTRMAQEMELVPSSGQDADKALLEQLKALEPKKSS